MRHAKSCPRSIDKESPCTCGGLGPVPPGLTVDGPAVGTHAGGAVDGVKVDAVIFRITAPGVFALRYPNADHSGMWLERVDNKPGSVTDENAADTGVRK